MESSGVDFGIVERTWEARLRVLGLSPTRIGTGIATGHDKLELYRGETVTADVELTEPPSPKRFMGSIEVRIALDVPDLGAFEVRDLVTQRGSGLNESLEACANTFMDVTYPPLEALFTGRRPEGPGTGKVTLTSFTIELDRAIQWGVFLGQLQILNDPDGSVRARLKEQLPLGMVMDALTNHLGEPRLHWCRLYGASLANGIRSAVPLTGKSRTRRRRRWHRSLATRSLVSGSFASL